MLKISNKKMQKIFGKSVIPNIKVLGVDGASKSGWCKIRTDKINCYLDYGFIAIKSSDKCFKYNQIIDLFQDVIKDNDIIVIEEAFYKRNKKVFQMLSQIGAIIYTLAHLAGINNKQFVPAITVRKYVGLQGNAKKEVIQEEFLKKFSIKVTDNDVVDAVILALFAVLKENTLEI